MKTIKERYCSSIIINKSEFISILLPLHTILDAREILDEIKKEYPKATHYCYGYVFDGFNKSSDDGEPSKTAGKPILEMILKHDLNRVILVVVRYFGGIKLGAGGLTRAYIESACSVIDKATIYQVQDCEIYKIEVDYGMCNAVKRYLEEINANIISIDYDDNVVFLFSIMNLNKDEINDFFNGKLVLTYTGNQEYLIKESEVKK